MDTESAKNNGEGWVAPKSLTAEQRLDANRAAKSMVEEQTFPESDVPESTQKNQSYWENKAIERAADLLIHPNEAGLATVEQFKADAAAEQAMHPGEEVWSQRTTELLDNYSTVAEQVAHIQKYFPGKYETDLAA